ncbi:MAG: ATP-binding cassette domain-containing protein [Methanoregulaceae archaeon]|nr:ATP-binding cassette domain-containing protein [Methanoregulaceae archaeon]
MRGDALTKRFNSFLAVNDISIAVNEGEFFGFLGPNGAGKTTTIRLLTGILPPDSGSVEIAGINLSSHPLMAKMLMGVIPEHSTIYGDLTPVQNLNLVGKFYRMGARERDERIQELIPRLGLSEHRDRQVRVFSKGMKQRISIGCAILHRPRVLFLDEPTEGLDVQSRRLIVDIMRELQAEGTTIFLTTHNIEEASTLCQRVAIINRGSLVAVERPEVLKQTFETSKSVRVSFSRDVPAGFLENEDVSRITETGDKFILYTANPDAVVKEVVRRADREGLTITSLQISGPSLEEVFVHLTGGN